MKNIKSLCDRCSKKSDNCSNNNGFYNYCESCLKNMIDLYVNYLVINEDFGKSK